MPEWASFVGLTGIVLASLILLSRASQGIVEPTAPMETAGLTDDARQPVGAEESGSLPDEPTRTPEHGLPSGALLANVAVTQGLFGAVLAAGAWIGGIPADALGLDPVLSPMLLLLGVAFGVGLYVADEALAAVAASVGIEYAEELRELLAPDSVRGWVLLLLVVLPIIAGFEELLFRAALIGALSAGYGISPWLLAVGSTVLFALGHGAQGRGGILVTGALGFVLAAAFVLTESFLVVFVAHYMVNALEFVVHEGLGIEWVGAQPEE